MRSGGAFAKLWNQQAFIGPRVFDSLELHSAATCCLPADFHSHRAIVLPAGWLAREAPDVLAQIVRHAPRRLLVLLVSSADEREMAARALTERGLPAHAVCFRAVATNTGWVRDYGPIFVREASGCPRAIDAVYGSPGRDGDDAATRPIAKLFGLATTATPLRWQGGNLLSNGRGLVLTTTQSINANVECGREAAAAARFLGESCGASELVVLEPLRGERTGHVDMFACFTSPDTVVVGRFDASVDPDGAAVLDRNAARLAELRTRAGKLRVVRAAMPNNSDGLWRSYTNVIFADGTLLVPTYPDIDRAGGERALAEYRRLLPCWKIVGIDCRTLARHQGGLRCVSLPVPR